MTTVPELDELTITIVVDNTTDILSSIAPGVPQLPEIAYLLGCIPPPGHHDGTLSGDRISELVIAP